MPEMTPEQQAAALAPRPLGGQWDVAYTEPQVDPLSGQQMPAMVVVQVTDPAGVSVKFLDPDTALQVAEMIRTNARTAKGARLVLPPGLANGNGGLL